jgi:hypothetical protein
MVIDTYRPARFSLPMLLLAGAAVLFGLSALAFVYQKSIDVNPFYYVNVLLTAVLALIAGGAMSVTAKIAHCRNVAGAVVLGLVVGCAVVGASHVAASHRLSAEAGSLPFGTYLEVRAADGWGVGRAPEAAFSGSAVWLIWLLEAFAIVGASVAGGYRGANAAMLEAAADAWTDAMV